MNMKTVYQKVAVNLGKRIKETPDARNEILLESALNGLKAFEGDRPVCWMGFNAPAEIPLALGYVPFYPEIAPGLLASFDLSAELVEMAERKFSNLFCCSFHRCSLAAGNQGMWPRPSAIMGISNICDGQVKLLSLLGDEFGIRPLILDVPSRIDEKGIDFLTQQIRGLVEPLEERAGQKLTDNNLLEAIRISNRTRRALMRIDELRKIRPSPFHGPRALNSLYVLMTQLWGLPRMPEILENMAREIEENEKTGPVNGEKFRLLSMIPPPTFKTDIYRWLEEEMGANMVMAELTDVTWEAIDEGDPFRGLASKLISHPYSGTIESRVAWALKAARDYEIDGVIHFSHWGCRQSSGGVGVIREKMDGIGVPLLNLDMDLIDPRSFSPAQVYTRIQGFIEMLTQRKE